MRSTRRTEPGFARAGRGLAYALCVGGFGVFAVAGLGGCPEPPVGPRYAGAGASSPRSGGTLQFFHESDVRGFDPHTSYDELSNMGIKLLFDGLLDYDHQSRLIPRLATEMPQVSPDGKTFHFTLRRGVRFHNGRELVAEDVRWSLEHVVHPDTSSPGSSFFAAIVGFDDFQAGRARHLEGVRVVNRYEVEITLKEPDQTFLNVMAMPFAYPVPREAYTADRHDFARRPVGTGAYMLESWESGMRVVFARNPRYWVPNQRGPERAVFLLNLPRDPAFMRFRNGEVDVIHRFTLADYLFTKRAEQWKPYREETPAVNLWGFLMNVGLPPFDNVHVRRAVSFAIDGARWSRARSNRLRVTGQPVPPGLLGYDPNLPGQHHFDLARAKEEMRLAGFPNGLSEPVTLWIGEHATGRIYGELAQADLRQIGIEIRLKPVTFPVLLRETGKPKIAQAQIGGWSQDFPDPANFLDILFHSRAIQPEDSQNRSFYSNPELDALLDAARIEQDVQKRGEMYRQAQMIIVRDAPWAFIWNDLKMEAWQPYVRGYRPHPVWDNMYRDVWLDLPRRRIAMRALTPETMLAGLFGLRGER